MFALAILIGIYSYLLFGLGLLGFLYKQTILIVSFFFLCSIFFLFKELPNKYLLKNKPRFKLVEIVILSFLFVEFVINLIGALGPELGFDALWYHLTIPKLYLQNHQVVFIPGSLLYYSAMPKLIEMLYTVGIAIQGEQLAKLTHFLFGLLSCIALYQVSRKFFSQTLSLIVVLIFYSNLVVLWQSITAYIDLGRTFFEILAFWAYINWVETKKRKWLIESSVMTGLAISSKLLAIGSIFIFSLLLLIESLRDKQFRFKTTITNTIVYLWFSFLVALPWFIFSYLHTKNLFYPFFTTMYSTSFDVSILNPLRFAKDVWIIFMSSSDPISPIYIIFFPLIILLFSKFSKNEKIICFYSLFAIIVWYITPRTGGGRFMLPYLPILTLLIPSVLTRVRTSKKKFLFGVIFFISVVSVLYRGVANFKYVPVVFGKETKREFLTKNLNFSFGDFYDTDGFLKSKIKSSDVVLLYGFHNLYYLTFPFIDSSWVKRGDRFNYIAIQNDILPKRFYFWKRIYKNDITHIELYYLGGQTWIY